MFRLVMFVEDKKLAPVLNALSGLVLNMEPPQPVTNAVKASKNNIKQASGETTIKDRVIGMLKARSGQDITTQEIKEMTVQSGGQPTSNASYITSLVEERVVKRKDRGVYHIV